VIISTSSVKELREFHHDENELFIGSQISMSELENILNDLNTKLSGQHKTATSFTRAGLGIKIALKSFCAKCPKNFSIQSKVVCFKTVTLLCDHNSRIILNTVILFCHSDAGIVFNTVTLLCDRDSRIVLNTATLLCHSDTGIVFNTVTLLCDRDSCIVLNTVALLCHHDSRVVSFQKLLTLVCHHLQIVKLVSSEHC